MVTKLPALKKNSIAVFHVSKEKSGKLRVSISMDDKEVTFDWTVSVVDAVFQSLRNGHLDHLVGVLVNLLARGRIADHTRRTLTAINLTDAWQRNRTTT